MTYKSVFSSEQSVNKSSGEKKIVTAAPIWRHTVIFPVYACLKIPWEYGRFIFSRYK